MTTEEKEKAIRWLTEEVRSLRMAPTVNGCKPDNWAEQLEIIETCLDAVRNHFPDTTKMVPLTLEQLRKMDGQPYWHVGLQEDSPEPHWKILDTFVAKHPEDYGYGKRWLAYAYPPAHIDMEAWSGCVCTTSDKSCCTCVSMNCHTCIRQSEYKRGRYCSACGRPMTEEARSELEKRLRG